MTTPSDVTVSDQQAETWTRLPAPFTKYEVSCDGFGPDQKPVRHIGSGNPLAVSVSNSGYPQVKPYDDDGGQQTVPVHQLVLLGWAGPCPPGQQCRHLDDDSFNNRWRPGATDDEVRANGGNLVYGTWQQNIADRKRNTPPKPPKPPRLCACGAQLTRGGKRCHDCVVKLGVDGTALLRSGMLLEDAGKQLAYPAVHLHTLCVKYGGWGSPPPRSHPVTATLRSIFRRDGS